MNLASHATVANRFLKGVLPAHKRYIAVIGSLLPDMNPKTQPHREENLYNRICNNHIGIKNATNEFEKSLRIGILLHYVCDYFCYAHNYDLDISHGKNHIVYEIALHKLLKNGHDDRLLHEIEYDNFLDYIVDIKTKYDAKPSHIERDLTYALSVIEQILHHNDLKSNETFA